ncbi:response regulator transcription factor [Streptomyces sp. I05A-00742]|uniref:response regulator transcription factor n=1 Tax=Streptomyces sp. I05A-00742 TaxID=2732853 RepID=UPI002898D16B|nr:response regulator transcription factor [Streptomyces sp. I05A-00742]
MGDIARTETPGTVKVLIAEDETLARAGLRLILEAAHDITVTDACLVAEALRTAAARRPDVVLLGVRPPTAKGLAVLRQLRALDTPPDVAVVTTLDSDHHIGEALRMGATGFLLRDTEPDVLTRSVRALATGAGCLSPPLLRRLCRHSPEAEPSAATGALCRLSTRERQTLDLLGQGLTNAEIGKRLNISTATVKDYVKSVLGKLGVANRTQAAVLATRTGRAPGRDGAPTGLPRTGIGAFPDPCQPPAADLLSGTPF